MEDSAKGCNWFLAQGPKYIPQKINSTKDCNTQVLFAKDKAIIIYLNGTSFEKIELVKKIVKTKLTELPSGTSPNLNSKTDENRASTKAFTYVLTIDENENFSFENINSEEESVSHRIASSSQKFIHLEDKLKSSLCCETTQKLEVKDEKLDEIMKSIATDPAFEELENDGESIEWIPAGNLKKGLIVRTLFNESSHFHQPVFLCEKTCTKYQRIELGDLKNLGIQTHRSGHFFIGQEGTNSSPKIFTPESTKPIKEFPKAKFATWLD